MRLARALPALPARQKQVPRLNYVEQQRPRDIGAQLQVTASRVCQVLRRAIDTLRATVISV